MKAPLPKNTGPARRGPSLPGAAPHPPLRGARLGSVCLFGSVFPLKTGDPGVTGLFRGKRRQGERQNRLPENNTPHTLPPSL